MFKYFQNIKTHNCVDIVILDSSLNRDITNQLG